MECMRPVSLSSGVPFKHAYLKNHDLKMYDVEVLAFLLNPPKKKKNPE